jgi:glycosyltransferase involved in cell wall biosynthesis
MRVLMILYNMTNKGTYWRGRFLSRSLAKRGHDMTFMITSPQNRHRFHVQRDPEDNVLIVETPDLLSGPLRSGWDVTAAMKRIQWIKRQPSFDLIHAFESRPVVLLPARYLQHNRGLPLVLDWADWFGKGGSVEERSSRLIRTILRPVETYFEERYRTKADYTTVINSFLGQRAIDLGVDPETILHISNASAAEEFKPILKEKARDIIGWSHDIPVVGYIGAIFWRDAVLMASAFDILRESMPEARLLVAGYCQIPVEGMVKDSDSVIRTGPIRTEQISHYLSACDVCWLPYRDSGANRGRFPGKLYDYMAIGKPVVTTDIGDTGKLVKEGQFGLTTTDDPEDHARQLQRLLEDPDLMQQMGERARTLAETDHHWDRRGEMLETFYEQILAGQV